MFCKTENLISFLLSSAWCKWLGVALLGTIGISLFKTGIMALAELVDPNPTTHSNNNGNGTVPWYYLTVYTFGIVFLSYYLGGVFNSQFIEEAENSTSARLLKLKSQLTLLPISQLIRKHRLEEHRLKLKGTRKNPGDELDSNKLFVESRDLLIDAILDGYILPWYNKISEDPSFLEHSRDMLQNIFDQLKSRIQLVNRTELAKEIVQTFHCHWKEYCAAIDKIKSPKETLIDKFSFSHTFISDRNDVRKQYEALLCMIISEILPADVKSHIFSQFISGILVKGVFLYYADMISDPKWINTTLVTIITSGNFVNTETSSNPSGSNISTALPSPNSAESPSLLPCVDDKSDTVVSQDNENNLAQTEPRAEEFLSKGDTLMEVVAKKGSIQEFLRLESQRKQMEDPSNGGRSPVFNSIQAALSGLLSATALPLLPDRSSFQDIAQKSDVEIETEGNNTKAQVIILPIPKEKSKDLSVRFSNDKITNLISSPVRHHSWEESTKYRDSNKPGGKQVKSLDENIAAHSFARQEEFDAGLLGNDISHNRNIPPQASPMYDEPEDFAATIAKLRSLLEQRESQTNLVETQANDNQDTDSGVDSTQNAKDSKLGQNEPIEKPPSSVPAKSPLSKIRPSLDSQSSSSSLTSNGSNSRSNTSHGSMDMEGLKMDKILDETEEMDPVISRFFLDVSIPKTESCGDNSGQFTLYCIQYEGVYIEDNGDENPPKLVLRTTTVKRSFKEFLQLQNKLEESPIWRPHLRGIKTPNKWLNLSFSNQSSGNNRRNLLERYLQQLCSHPVLGFCPDIRHFMAYGDDGFQMFGLPSSGANRFDKLTKTFTGVLNTLRDALPTFESDSLAPNPDICGISPTESRGKKFIPSFFQFGENKNSEEAPKNSEEQANFSEVFDLCDNDEKAKENEDLSDSKGIDYTGNDEMEGLASLCQTDYTFDTEYPLALAVTNLLCDVLWLPHRKPQSASVSAFMSLSGKSLENYLQESLDIFLSEDAFLGYMDLLTSTVNEWATTDGKDLEKDELAYSQEDLKTCLKHRVPVWVRWMWGKSRLELTIDRLVGFFQHTMINHDFILSVIELIFSKLKSDKI